MPPQNPPLSNDTSSTPVVSPRPDAKPGPYVTQLAPPDELAFQAWVGQNNIPFDSSPNSDYDMRGFWKAQQSGDPYAQRSTTNQHFPDTFKTPYHESFSNESMYALPTAPRWKGNQLVDSAGKIVFDEDAKKNQGFSQVEVPMPPTPKRIYQNQRSSPDGKEVNVIDPQGYTNNLNSSLPAGSFPYMAPHKQIDLQPLRRAQPSDQGFRQIARSR